VSPRKERPRRRSGQALIFLVMVVVVLFFVILWNFDLHKIFHVKLTSQNAGDAAALSAARWQGITLNLIGDLNLLHLLALSAGDQQSAESITNIQARLCFVGPMIALVASQQGAKNNGAYQNEDFTALLREHARAVREDYPSRTSADGEMLFPEPYENAWAEYAAMLDLVASDGVAAGPDNARYFTDAWGGHILLDQGFYGAIAGRDWCWFYHNAPNLLQDYRNFFPCWWPPLPEIRRQTFMNSEFFGLGLTCQVTAFSDAMDVDVAARMAAIRGLPDGINSTGGAVRATWYCYGEEWHRWDAMDLGGDAHFPATGPVRQQYDYAGADAATRVEARVPRMTPGPGGSTVTNNLTWTAAAKPFGSLEGPVRPNEYGIVLPAFTDVRLIPVDASSAPSGGSYNLGWRTHVELHLPEYMVNGPGPSGCWYCRQLLTWEDPQFRQQGVEWLEANSERCTVRGGGGGGGGGGGSRRGH
jgi:hypothetical protein